MQIKTRIKYNFTPIRLIKIKKILKIAGIGNGVDNGSTDNTNGRNTDCIDKTTWEIQVGWLQESSRLAP